MLGSRSSLLVFATTFFATGALVLACSSIKEPGAEDGLDPNGGTSSGTSGGGGGTSSGTSGGGDPQTGTSSGGTSGTSGGTSGVVKDGGGDASSSSSSSTSGTVPPAKVGDPRWALGKVPADAPSPTSYEIINSPLGAVVIDKVTSLMWQDMITTSSLTGQAAIDHCDSLSYGGYDDWRAPTRMELAGLAVFADTAATVAKLEFNSTALSGFTQQCLWSQSKFPMSGGGTGRSWYVDRDYVMMEYVYNTCGVRCVRNAPAVGTPVPRQYILALETVTDQTSGLIWERNAPTVETAWAAAQTRCAGLTLGGKTARLPTVKELLTLVDELKSTNPISTSFTGAKEDRQWTAVQKWGVSFNAGQVIPTAQSHTSRCVASL